ncbi:Poly(A) polymerase [Wallemia mellicola]|nr:Poly(A) polymerase [Wallemia mellicola]
MDEKKQWGITPPISLASPTDLEKQVDAGLIQELKDQNTIESEQESLNREKVLALVQSLVKEFVKRVSIRNGMSESLADQAGGKIFTFGSYRLGVNQPGADIDTLCVVPKHVSREDFFDVFEPLLKTREEVSVCAGVPDAYVPIIKTTISGIEIDFLVARLALATIPDDLELADDNLLKNLDERCVRSLNGSRVTDEILRVVPNVQVFRESLRCIKLWAQRRAIYSNVNGFLGGVAWAMLVARICQLYPNENAGAVIAKFFTILYQWKWPHPVLLKEIEDGPLKVRVWNPKVDRAHRMPIITPAYPSMCSTHNVGPSTQEVMRQEFKRGMDILDGIHKGTTTWSQLFNKHEFFSKYKHYLQIIASGQTAESQKKWSGAVESKVRQLVSKLELVDGIELAHPFVKGFSEVFICLNDEEVQHAAEYNPSEEVKERSKKPEEYDNKEAEDGIHRVYISTFYIGLAIQPRNPETNEKRTLNLTYPTNEFMKLTKLWDQFVEGEMKIFVKNIKASALPDVVFEGGIRTSSSKSSKKKSKRPSNVMDESNGENEQNKRLKQYE